MRFYSNEIDHGKWLIKRLKNFDRKYEFTKAILEGVLYCTIQDLCVLLITAYVTGRPPGCSAASEPLHSQLTVLISMNSRVVLQKVIDLWNDPQTYALMTSAANSYIERAFFSGRCTPNTVIHSNFDRFVQRTNNYYSYAFKYVTLAVKTG